MGGWEPSRKVDQFNEVTVANGTKYEVGRCQEGSMKVPGRFPEGVRKVPGRIQEGYETGSGRFHPLSFR